MDVPQYANQTEMLLAHARDGADRRLIEFGYDPSVADWFLTLTPAVRLRYVESWAELIVRRRAELGLA